MSVFSGDTWASVRRLALDNGVKRDTVAKWKVRRRIPAEQRIWLAERAKEAEQPELASELLSMTSDKRAVA